MTQDIGESFLKDAEDGCLLLLTGLAQIFRWNE
jgi:hypothetical protein